MSAATMQSAPVVPPRPARSQGEGNDSAPTIPARPTKRLNRAISPNPDRFAPSPLNESLFDPKAKRNSQSLLGEESGQSTRLNFPGVGEEGQEYAAAIEALASSPELSRAASPEQTRIVGHDLKLHAPKPTVPAASAKLRVAAVTRTDSDRAAAFGFGRPSSVEPLLSGARSLKKKGSTTSQLSHHSELHTDDEHGIPEIGQRVPMLSYAGDVQAPSPAPRAASVDSSKSNRHHTRRTSSRNGFHDLPPGSYGLHGHGVESTDKLQKAYYEKHPDIYQKEHHYNHLHDRVHDYSMSSENLNKIVRDTASRGVGFGTSEYNGTPSEQVGFQASDEYTMRVSTPQSSSTGLKTEALSSSSKGGLSESGDGKKSNVIHIDEVGQREGSNDESAEHHGAPKDDSWPILAADEVAKDPSPFEQHPAVPSHWRGVDEPRSRPSSRPTSIYNSHLPEIHCTPLEDVEEYEPLFPENERAEQKPKAAAEKLKEYHQRFPSRDVWEDAPNSVHSTAEVSTPELVDASLNPRSESTGLPVRDAETPAQLFARKQEELAEKEAVTPDSFLNRQQRPELRVEHLPYRPKEMHSRPSMPQRFPSQDIWEDTPDSLQFTTTVSHPQSPDDSTSEEVMKSPVTTGKPIAPAHPPKQQGSGDDGSKPTVPNRPKPQIPARPVKPAAETKQSEGVTKQKPVVPARPMGSKIAALQAGFMSDLNNRLRLGPHAPKKEAPPEEEAIEEKKAPAPLSDARKGRARGPQRRAPTTNPSAGTDTEKSIPPSASNGHLVLSLSMTRTLWSIDEEGTMTVDDFGSGLKKESEIKAKDDQPRAAEVKVEETGPEEIREAQLNKPTETEVKAVPEKKTESLSGEINREAGIIQDKTEHGRGEETPSEISENKTPGSSEAQDIVEETKLPVPIAGESVPAEMDKNEEGDETRVEEVKSEVAL